MIQSIHPPPSAYEIGVCSSINKDQHSRKCKDSIQSFINEKGQISHQKPDDEKTLQSTSSNDQKKHNCEDLQSFLLSFEHHDLSKMENERDIRKCESLLPTHGRCDGALSCTNANNINVQPQSPVLGSGRVLARSCSPVLKGRKVQMKSSFDALKKRLNFSDAAPVKRQINSDDISVNLEFSVAVAAREEEEINVNSYNGHSPYSNIRKRCLNDGHDATLDKHILHFNSVQNGVTQSPEKINSSLVTYTDCRGEHIPFGCSEVVHPGSHGNQDDSKTFDVNLKPLLRCDLSLSEEYLGVDIDECSTSDTIAVSSEGTDHQLDHNIKASATSHENSMNDFSISEVSLLQILVELY